MKRTLIAVVAMLCFSVVSFAQAVPAVKKNEPAKTHAVKKATDGKALTLNKATKPVLAKTPATTKVAVKSKTVANVNTAKVLKKDGTPDKRFKANKAVAASRLKKDGTADLRYKANKKHS